MNDEHATPILTPQALWQFSVHYYCVREIKEACLRLQNHHHGNINLLLLCKWLDEQQLSVAQADWPALHTALADTDYLLANFRDWRHRVKSHLPDALYREALQFELQLEKQQQADLLASLQHLTLHPAQAISLTQQYCHMLGADDLAELFSAPYAPQHHTQS